MALTLRQKVELYEDTLKRIAQRDTDKQCEEALEDSHNPGKGAPACISKYPFAFGI